MSTPSIASASDATIILEVREIAETASALAFLEVAHLDPQRVPRSVMPPSAALESARLDPVERASLAASVRGVTRQGAARSATWWRRAIDSVRHSPDSPDQDGITPAGDWVATATPTLFVELSVRALAARRSPGRVLPNSIDSEVDRMLAGLTRQERIVLAQHLAQAHAVLPTSQSRDWWVARINEAQQAVAGTGNASSAERLARALSIGCMG